MKTIQEMFPIGSKVKIRNENYCNETGTVIGHKKNLFNRDIIQVTVHNHGTTVFYTGELTKI